MELGLNMNLPGPPTLPKDDYTAAGYGSAGAAIGNKFTGNLDWERSQISSAQDYERSMELLRRQNEMNRRNALEEREWTAAREDSKLKRTAEQLKEIGINPMMYFSSGGNAGQTLTAPTARVSGTAFHGRNYQSDQSGFAILANIGSAIGALATAGFSSALQRSKIAAQKELNQVLKDSYLAGIEKNKAQTDWYNRH